MSGKGFQLPNIAIPDITGGKFPKLDTAFRLGIFAAATGGTGAMIAWMNSRGYSNQVGMAFLPFVIITVLVAVATFIWSIIAKNAMLLKIAGLIDHTIDTSQTGQIAPEVKAMATPQQQQRIADAGK